jgi:putative sigma-54 modulation protein
MANPIENIDNRILMQGVHLELTDALKNAIYEKFSTLLRHEEHIVRINVRIHQDQTMGHEHNYTVTAQVEIRGPDLVAHAQGKDPYNLLDEVVDKLDTLVRKRSGRQKDKRNHPHDIELDADLPKIGSDEAESLR